MASNSSQGEPSSKPRSSGVALDAVLDLINDRHRRRDSRRPPPLDHRSELAADDSAVLPHLVSGAIQGAVSQALDHLQAIRSLIQDQKVVHPWAQYTLSRAALEAAATALWIVAPQDACERRARLLRLVARDIKDSEAAHKLHQATSPAQRSHQERRDELLELAPPTLRRQLFARSVSYSRIVRDAAPSIGVEPDALEMLWRALSGLAHGAQWASLAMLPRTVTNSERVDVAHVRFTGNVDTLLLIANRVVRMTDEAERLYEVRARAMA